MGLGIRGRAALRTGAASDLRIPRAAARVWLGRPAHPLPISEVSLPEPRLRPPASLAEICFTDPYERALHAYGRSYRDVVRAFRGRFDYPPDVVVRPRTEQELSDALDWALSGRGRGDPVRRRDSVVGGVEARIDGAEFAGVVTIDVKRSIACSRSIPSRYRRAIQAGATRPNLEDSWASTG